MNKADKLKYKALRKALELGDAKVLIDTNRLCKVESPVYNPWEVLLPILVPALLGLILIMSVGILFGLLFMIILIFLSNTFVKRHINIRLIKRTKDYMTNHYDDCQKLWEYGGVVLINTNNTQTGCVAPEGSWKDFVTLNYADYMAEKKDISKITDIKEGISA